jgi:hypothetical protein
VTTAHVYCPYPPCKAEWWIGVEPGAVFVSIPLHKPEGFEGAEWYTLRCPGALGLVTPEGELNVQTAGVVNRAYEHYMLALAHHREKAEREAEAERGKTAPHIGFPVGRPVDPNRPADQWFPGRPADAPEPGPGEAHPQVEIGTGHHLGRAAVDNAHDTTKGLVILAMAKMRESQGKLAGCAAALNGSIGIATMAEIEATAGNTLVIAAVGTGAGKPRPAEAMAEQMAMAIDTIMGPNGGNIFNAIEVARIRVETASQQLTAAISQAEQYVALLS